MDNKQELKELRANPIFAMSLSSKELFHSNFWAWLFERNIAYAKIFFPEIKNIELVEREKKHRDISVWQSKERQKDDVKYDNVFIIENKFKSIPTKEQLVGYQEAIEAPKNKNGGIVNGAIRNFSGGVLTGLTKPDFIDGMDKWHFLSYDKIGKNIVSTAKKIEEKDGFIHNLIVEYGEMIQKLQSLLLKELKLVGKTWNTSKIAELKELRLHDIFGKLMAGELAAYLKENLSLHSEIKGYKLVIEGYYGQGGAGVDVRYVNMSNKLTVIGVQIEPSQYRICAQWDGSTGDNMKKRDVLFDSLKKENWFVEYTNNKEICFHNDDKKHKTSLSKKYGIYDSSKDSARYTFLYQYWNLSNTPFKELCANIQRDMNFAYDILKN